jgi:hypothetical protein
MASHKTGGEIDGFCAKCGLTLAHTILAMVGTKVARVKCNTCGADHALRSAPGSKPARAAGGTRGSGARESAPSRTVLSYEAQLAGKDTTRARPYKASDTYAVDDLVQHPTFGLGLIYEVRGDKMEVTFKATAKTLAHARGGGARPAYHPPAAASQAPADKPTGE